MCPNIDTEEGVAATILSFEHSIFKHDIGNTPIPQLLRALRLMMKHNVFKFGDTCYRQMNGAAIGSVPESDWETTMFNFYEVATIEPTFRQNLRLDTRFLDGKNRDLVIASN